MPGKAVMEANSGLRIGGRIDGILHCHHPRRRMIQ
jgi:hypothetical protein